MKRPYKIVYGLLLIVLTAVGSYVYSDLSKVASATYNKRLPIFSVETEEKKVALTFDVNWAEKDYLEDILDVLEKNDVKATFFVMGGWVNYSDENLQKLIKIKNGGHEIGNHSYIHPMFTKVSKERIDEEINKTEAIFKEVLGCESTVFRFPSGDFNEESVKYMEEKGYRCIQWNVDSIDYKESGEDIEYNRVIKKVKPGAIILFHNNAKYTPKNLEKLIKQLGEDGYTFETISDLIYDNDSFIDQDGVQHKNNY